jgi:bifunctional N-acetylglucosamine-1-phosphate-uridyltransferase/glucosamine-1-phosphate-acetyltransferase GlmU-like protein
MSNFRLTLATLTALAVISGGTAVAISNQSDALNPQQEQIIITCNDTWKITIGAIAGLLGGRSRNRKGE